MCVSPTNAQGQPAYGLRAMARTLSGDQAGAAQDRSAFRAVHGGMTARALVKQRNAAAATGGSGGTTGGGGY